MVINVGWSWVHWPWEKRREERALNEARQMLDTLPEDE